MLSACLCRLYKHVREYEQVNPRPHHLLDVLITSVVQAPGHVATKELNAEPSPADGSRTRALDTAYRILSVANAAAAGVADIIASAGGGGGV